MDEKLHSKISKPRRIILIRHGECHANTDKSKFATEPDYTIELTEKGIEQAREVRVKLKELVGKKNSISMFLLFGIPVQSVKI